MGELKPCPWCGPEAEPIGFTGLPEDELPAIVCPGCGTEKAADTIEKAILKWNTRADDARITELLEAVDAMLEQWNSHYVRRLGDLRMELDRLRAAREKLR